MHVGWGASLQGGWVVDNFFSFISRVALHIYLLSIQVKHDIDHLKITFQNLFLSHNRTFVDFHIHISPSCLIIFHIFYSRLSNLARTAGCNTSKAKHQQTGRQCRSDKSGVAVVRATKTRFLKDNIIIIIIGLTSIFFQD